jgi:fatty-acid peroxygenase
MAIPRDTAFDSSLNLVREGYDFIWNRCQRFGSDQFETRIMGQKTVCIHGPEAAALFYDNTKFQRERAVPRRVVTSLFGKGAVHTLDDAAHQHRKAAFLRLMTPAEMTRLMDETAQSWRRSVHRWEKQIRPIVLFDEVRCLLAEAICSWAGVPLRPTERDMRGRDLAYMVDSFGGVGPRMWRGKLARVRCERWIGRLIDRTRRGDLHPKPDTGLHVMAHHRDLDGQPLDTKTAAVELLNILRPTVAIAWYVAFAAVALHEHPELRDKIAREAVGEEAGEYADLFMQEVRRFYPFTPYLGAKVRSSFHWKGHDFKPGDLVLLDVYGTHHDPRVWPRADVFEPERFREWSGGLYDFMPQGGGEHATGHRCPGEWITMHNLTLALHFLTRCVTYEMVPGQDLSMDRTRMPTRPKSGVLLRNVRATAALHLAAPRLPSTAAVCGVPTSPKHAPTQQPRSISMER